MRGAAGGTQTPFAFAIAVQLLAQSGRAFVPKTRSVWAWAARGPRAKMMVEDRIAVGIE